MWRWILLVRPGNQREIAGNALIMDLSFQNPVYYGEIRIFEREIVMDFNTHCLMEVIANFLPTHMFFPAPHGMV